MTLHFFLKEELINLLNLMKISYKRALIVFAEPIVDEQSFGESFPRGRFGYSHDYKYLLELCDFKIINYEIKQHRDHKVVKILASIGL